MKSKPENVSIRLLPLATICLLLCAPPAARAQDDEGAAPAVRGDDQPAAAPRTGPKVNLRLEEPAVRSVLAANPTTPKELVRATDVLVDLHREDLARPLLQQLLEGKPDAQTLAGLARDFGSPTFIKFAADPGLAPQGGQLAEAVLSAAYAARTDPALLERLVKQLGAAEPRTREDAIVALSQAQGAAVTPLVKVLVDASRAGEHQAARNMLALIGADAIGPLTAMLDAHDPAAQAEAARVLGRLRAQTALPGLLSAALAPASSGDLKTAAGEALWEILDRMPTAAEAHDLLAHQARTALAQVKELRADPQPSVELWTWDAQQQMSVLGKFPPADAAAIRADRLATDAYLLVSDPPTQQLAVLAQLTAAKLLGGLDHPLPAGEGTVRAKMDAVGSAVIEEVLKSALAQGQTTAATAAAEILGDIGREEILQTSGGALSPLAEAARSADRRLRFAAVDAILKLKPTRPFAGAGTIAQNLAYFAGTSGFRRALVGHPRTERGQQLVGLLAGLGYEAENVNNSRQFLIAASESADYELGLIHISLGGPPADDLLARLRRDPRTADLPIGLIAPEELFADAERMALATNRVIATPPVRSEAALKFQTDRLLRLAGRELVTFAERQAQAATALNWLAELTDKPQKLFDLQGVEPAVNRALYVPALSRQAALVLSNLPNATAQFSLANLAGRNVLPLAARQTAAMAFSRSVRLHGVLLTSGELREQYDRYNTSRTLDRDTQQVLGSLLDAIESRTKADEPAQP